MKTFLALALIVLTGCAQYARLPETGPEATAKVREWVPNGTPVNDARAIMERRHFVCMMRTNDVWRDMRHLDYLLCRGESSGVFVKRIWTAALVVRTGKIADVYVTTGLVGL